MSISRPSPTPPAASWFRSKKLGRFRLSVAPESASRRSWTRPGVGVFDNTWRGRLQKLDGGAIKLISWDRPVNRKVGNTASPRRHAKLYLWAKK
jgi:hypothetical protein